MNRLISTGVLTLGLAFGVMGCQQDNTPPSATDAGGSPTRTPSGNSAGTGSTPGIENPSKTNDAAPVDQSGAVKLEKDSSMSNQGTPPSKAP